MSMWSQPRPPKRRLKAKPPTRSTIRQWGYRVNETGVERWFRADLQHGNAHGGGNGATRQQVVDAAEQAVKAASDVGVDVTWTLLYRDHLTTTWSRWLDVEEA